MFTVSTLTLKWLYRRINGDGTGKAASSYPGDVQKDGQAVNNEKSGKY